jgi:hypothetical protein
LGIANHLLTEVNHEIPSTGIFLDSI